MIQNSRALTEGTNPISLISTGRATTLEDYPVIVGRRIPMSTIEQGWTFEAEEQARASRTTLGFVSTLVKTIDWLSHLGSGRIHDGRLESRHNIYHNLTTNRLRF